MFHLFSLLQINCLYLSSTVFSHLSGLFNHYFLDKTYSYMFFSLLVCFQGFQAGFMIDNSPFYGPTKGFGKGFNTDLLTPQNMIIKKNLSGSQSGCVLKILVNLSLNAILIKTFSRKEKRKKQCTRHSYARVFCSLAENSYLHPCLHRENCFLRDVVDVNCKR